MIWKYFTSPFKHDRNNKINLLKKSQSFNRKTLKLVSKRAKYLDMFVQNIALDATQKLSKLTHSSSILKISSKRARNLDPWFQDSSINADEELFKHTH